MEGISVPAEDVYYNRCHMFWIISILPLGVITGMFVLFRIISLVRKVWKLLVFLIASKNFRKIGDDYKHGLVPFKEITTQSLIFSSYPQGEMRIRRVNPVSYGGRYMCNDLAAFQGIEELELCGIDHGPCHFPLNETDFISEMVVLSLPREIYRKIEPIENDPSEGLMGAENNDLNRNVWIGDYI